MLRLVLKRHTDTPSCFSVQGTERNGLFSRAAAAARTHARGAWPLFQLALGAEPTCAAVCVSQAHRQLVLSRERVGAGGTCLATSVLCCAVPLLLLLPSVFLLVEDTRSSRRRRSLALRPGVFCVRSGLKHATLSSCFIVFSSFTLRQNVK